MNTLVEGFTCQSDDVSMLIVADRVKDRCATTLLGTPDGHSITVQISKVAIPHRPFASQGVGRLLHPCAPDRTFSVSTMSA